MKKYVILLAAGLVAAGGRAQEQRVCLSPEQVEVLFLKENLRLIAEHMNVDRKEAEVVQAGLWGNPELAVGQLNVWQAGREREFSVELSQLVRTAGKRRKAVARERAGKDVALQEFEVVLRELRLELRKSVHELLYWQAFGQVLSRQAEVFGGLIPAYRKQVEQGNVAKTELLRLQSFSLALDNEINEAQGEINARQRQLKSLLNMDYRVVLELDDAGLEVQDAALLSLDELVQSAIASRPEIRRQEMEVVLHEKSLAYEQALRVPDLTISAAYDRCGGVWRDFAGLGVSMGLPLFNRNQGGVRMAKVAREQSLYALQQQQNAVAHEVAEAFASYQQAYLFYRKTSENELLAELDGMLGVYANNLLNKNLSMLEYVDFMETYKANKRILLVAKKQANVLWEELRTAN